MNKINNLKKRCIFLRRLKKYIIERFPYDFAYLGKSEINETMNKLKIHNK